MLQNISFKTFYEEKAAITQQLNLNIANEINEIFIIKDNYQQGQKEYKAIGDKAAITANIAAIQKEIADLKSKSGFSEAEVKKYGLLVKKKEIATNNMERLEKYLEKIDEYTVLIDQLKTSTEEDIENFVVNEVDFSDDILASHFISINKDQDVSTTNSAYQAIKDKYAGFQVKIRRVIDVKTEALNKIEKDFEPFNAKIKSQEQLKALNQKLEQDQQKIKQLDEKQKQLQKIADAGKLKKEQILRNSDELFATYQSILVEIKKPGLAQIGNDLKLDAKLDIDLPSFQNGFCSLLDGRSNFNVIFGESFNSNNEYVYDEQTHQSNLKTIYEKVWFHEKNSIKFKAGFGPKQAISQLLKDNFKFKYNILYNGDDILQMSPGKRGLVLMQIILHLSNAEHPILIDQPEDNLDNRTIYNDLNGFIKEKKIKRQIILVTHNANLVVSTDAEQVIVANQNGQDKGKSNEKYQFEYTSGSLENTFKDASKSGILNQMGIREHVCDILEGGEAAFQYREKKYGFSN